MDRNCAYGEYGEPAYPLRWYLHGPFGGAQITADQN